MLETGRVLLALARVDVRGDWGRFWMHVGYAPMRPLASAPDSGMAAPEARWAGVPMSTELESCLSLVAAMSLGAGMVPTPPGALALGLLADPDAGAARTILGLSEVDHESLIEFVETELLGARLVERPPEATGSAGDLGQPSAPDWPGRAKSLAVAREPDDLDLLLVFARTGELDERANASLLVTVLEEVSDEARSLGTRSLDDVAAGARTEFEVSEPNARQLLYAASDRPSAALARVLRVVGMSPRLLATGAIEREEFDGKHNSARTGGRTRALSVMNLAIYLAVPALLIQHVYQTDDWCALVFLPGTFLGPPATSVWVSVTLAAAMAVFVPVASAVQVIELLTSFSRDHSERRSLAGMTGVFLSAAEYRAFCHRRTYTARFRRRRDAWLVPLRIFLLRRDIERHQARSR
jgi:hypothetical protein